MSSSQAHIAAAVAAGPASWTLQEVPDTSKSHSRTIFLAPSLTKAAARLDDRLVVWEWPGRQEAASLAAPVLPPSSAARCIWSACSTSVAFLDCPGHVGLLDLCTGEGSIGCLQRKVNQVRCLPGRQGLLVCVGDGEWLVLKPDACGELKLHAFPAKPVALLAVSALGRMAFNTSGDAGTLLSWAPASVRRSRPLFSAIKCVAWAPCATMVACYLGAWCVVLSAEGRLITQQESPLPTSYMTENIELHWGSYGLLFAGDNAVSTLICLCDVDL